MSLPAKRSPTSCHPVLHERKVFSNVEQLPKLLGAAVDHDPNIFLSSPRGRQSSSSQAVGRVGPPIERPQLP